MSEQVFLKLVKAERYMSPLTGDNVIEKGNVVTVSREVADMLLLETNTDTSNNVHNLWQEVSEEQAAEVEDDEDFDDEAPAKPARSARPARTKK